MHRNTGRMRLQIPECRNKNWPGSRAPARTRPYDTAQQITATSEWRGTAATW